MRRPPSTNRRRLPVVFALCSALIMPAVSSAASHELRRGVVVDSDAALVYVMSAGGGIDAVDLRLGTVSWHSDEAARPLATADGQLLAQAEARTPGALTLVVLDDQGRSVAQTDYALPEGAASKVVDDLRGSFEVGATAAASGFEVSWRSTERTPRGALLEDELAEPRVLSGAFFFDPNAQKNAQFAPRALRSAAFQPPQVAVPEAQRLAATPGRQFFSPGEQEILVSEPLESSVGGPTHRWTLFDAAGKRLGQVDSPTAYSPFFVTESLVLFETQPRAWAEGNRVVEEPLALRALSLENGREQWTIALRDTRFRGPFPP